ncbi:TonB-dependent siderophore myxochelin receptor MxcH [Pendulispora rubella]|uniref:TonB-dependent siderophore myxochelin receptor MxcH n=1 Tax=Pendulispora rubella TaxID=2741070 RepID=A0ABZ2L764_9BACT
MTKCITDIRFPAAFLASLCAFSLGGAGVALAQDTGAVGASNGAAGVQPPELVAFVEAEYPPAALAARREGRVVLRLTLDREGLVIDADVKEPAGYGFDEAARSAALRFRFSPARRGDKPVAARILYTYEFRLPPEPEPPAAPPAPGVEQAPGAPAPRPPAAAEVPVEVKVKGLSEVARLRQSAQAVKVIELEQAQRETADLGEVLARSGGISVRRGGGLGAGTRLSLNGLTDDQIRFLVDGIPLELAGYPFGVANVPLNLVERVEIYRGVVPIRFGADALGGVVNLRTDTEVRGTHGAASYQVGSFGTHRLTFSGHTLDEPTGSFTRVTAFHDYAKNDYPVDVEAVAANGRVEPARVDRFHDAYRSTGASVETGLINRPWAKRLLLRAFVTDYAKEVQNNLIMSVPYGEVEYGELTAGATLRYENTFAKNVSVSFVGGYTQNRIWLRDVSQCVYSWFGRCNTMRPRGGEVDGIPHDTLTIQHSGFGRLNASWQLHPQHAVRLSLSPTYVTRTGDERRGLNSNERDPLAAQRDLFTLVSGLEYQIDGFGDRLENIAFVKDYLQLARAEEPRPGGFVSRNDRNTHRFGVGNAIRYRFLPWLYGKTSYELATRLPSPNEVFGTNGVIIAANLGLKPETSHNVNVGFTIDTAETRVGAWRFDVNAFLRETDNLIVLPAGAATSTYENILSARSLGAETTAGWTSPGEYLALDGNFTYLDFRNTSSEGTFGNDGDRIPNRPYLLANGSARLQFRRVAASNDEIALVWNTRYVHEFYRSWESLGSRESKQVVPSQLLHSLALTYLVRGNPFILSFTGEVQNLTNEPAYDFIGVQRPGRAFYFKTTAEF